MEKLTQRKSTGMDMLSGPLAGRIVLFALPLIASGILQQSFNATDAIVIGRYATSQALAAVGSNGPIINLIITLFVGLSVGVNVVIAHYIGRRDENGVRNSVSTAVVISLVSGIVLLLAGQVLSRPMLELLATPEDVIDLASQYLKIYFLGMPFLMVYNFGAAILRSIGDTRRPFYSLIVAGAVNVVLDLFFVGNLGMGVDGVAAATAIANGVNAAIMAWFLLTEAEPIRVNPRRLRISGTEFRKIVRIGLPAGIQGMVFSISNLFILSAINSFGSMASAGSAASLNYEVYCYFIVTAFVQSTVAFTSQNYAAGNIARCNRIFALNMLFAVVGSALMDVLIFWQGELCISLFTSDPDVMPFALVRVRYVLLFQFIACSYEISGAAMRGLGYSMTPTVLTIFGTCFFRLLWVYLFPKFGGGFKELMSVYPVTWIITGVAVVGAYLIVRRKAYSHLEPAR